MQNVLILTCSTGEGHNSAAKAVASAFRDLGVHTLIRDPVSFHSEKMTRIVSGLYNDTIRKAPSLFGAAYKMGDLYSASRLPSPIYWANSKYADRLKAFILENHISAVVCTHLYGMEAMMAIRKDPTFTVPCYGVLTDYVMIPFLEEIHLSGLFVPTEQVKQDLVSKGFAPETISVSGIPVDARFAEHPDKRQARESLGLPQDENIFLVMTGGVGCEAMEKLCGKLLEALEKQDRMVVFTGKNQELRQRLEAMENPKLQALGFTDRVALYMAAGDVLLSKPGGLSSTEAAVANIPMVHIRAIPGCETYNARYFDAHGMACHAKTDEDAVAFARILAHNREAAEKMCAMQRRGIHPRGAEQIAKEVMEGCCTGN